MKDILDCYPGIGRYEYMLSSQQVYNFVEGLFPTLLWPISVISTCLSVCLPLCLSARLSFYLIAWVAWMFVQLSVIPCYQIELSWMEGSLGRLAKILRAVTLTFSSFVSTTVSNRYKNSIIFLIELLALALSNFIKYAHLNYISCRGGMFKFDYWRWCYCLQE